MKKNGFSLLELLVVIGIIFLISSLFKLTTGNLNKNKYIKECEIKIPFFLRNYITKSFESGKRYKLNIDLKKKKISVYDEQNINKLDELKLNKNLNYYKKDDENSIIIKREITEYGNFSKGFSIIIGDKDKVYRKITADNTLAIRYGIIRVYSPEKGEYIPYNLKNEDKLWHFDYDK